MTYVVFHLVGYTEQKETVRGLELTDKVVVRLIDTSYESALQRAQLIIKRPNWLLAEVIEYMEGK